MRTRIKICGLTRTDDALAAVAAGADALGLVFHEPSPRAIAPEAAAQLVASLPPFVSVVGLFVDPVQEWVREVMAAVPLDRLQFHGDESAAFCGHWGRPYIKALRMAPDVEPTNAMAAYPSAAGILLDAYHPEQAGGTGECFDWERVPTQPGRPLILAGGLDPANVAEAVRRTRPWAVDVSSGVEAEPGRKDPARVAAFINEVERVRTE